MADDQNTAVPAVTDPKDQPTALDLTKVTDEEFAKVFEDQRLFNHPRFKQLNEKAKKLSEYEEQAKKAEEEKLKSQGEFQKLAEQKDQEAKVLREQLQNTKIDNQLQSIAQQLGAVDLDAVSKLVDRSLIKVNEDGSVEGVKEAVEKLQADKVFLFTKKATNIGGGTNPANPGTSEFTMSQIQDPAFYQAHSKEIQIAAAQGRIKNDRY